MWQYWVSGVLVAAAVAYAGWALWPKRSREGGCGCSTPAAKEKAPRPCDRGA